MKICKTNESLIDLFFENKKDNAEYVRRTLATAQFPLSENNQDQIHAAILLFSKGDIVLFEEAVEEALVDWRNIIIATGLAVDNWASTVSEKLKELKK